MFKLIDPIICFLSLEGILPTKPKVLGRDVDGRQDKLFPRHECSNRRGRRNTRSSPVLPLVRCNCSWPFGPPSTPQSGADQARSDWCGLVIRVVPGQPTSRSPRSKHGTEARFPYEASPITHSGSSGSACCASGPISSSPLHLPIISPSISIAQVKN